MKKGKKYGKSKPDLFVIQISTPFPVVAFKYNSEISDKLTAVGDPYIINKKQ